jgi:hypothetical protein
MVAIFENINNKVIYLFPKGVDFLSQGVVKSYFRERPAND